MKILISIICIVLVTSSFADDKPSFDNGILTIPSVSVKGKPGRYQNIIFQLSAQGNWTLQDVKVGKQIETQTQINSSGAVEILFGIQSVEIIKTDSFPVQVFLKIKGEFTNGCPEIGQINYQFNDNKFNVFVYYKNNEPYFSGELSCTAAIVPFEKIIGLPIYSFKTGEYKVTVNGLFPHTFSLNVDNEF